MLIRLHPGVYAVGHRTPDRRADLWAAWLYAGPDSIFSHQTGGELHDFHSTPSLIALTAPRRVRSRPGLVVHTTTALPPDEVRTVDGLPTTTVPRTLLDLAAVVTPRELEKALEVCHRRELGDSLPLSALLARYPGRRGAGTLRRALRSWTPGTSWTRSELEERFIRFLDDHGIDRGEANARVEGPDDRWLECDHVWHHRRLGVELDSREHHTDPSAIERDTAKRRALSAAGWTVIAVTWRQLERDPGGVALDLRRLLGPG